LADSPPEGTRAGRVPILKRERITYMQNLSELPEIANLTINSIPVIVAVLITVQALKVSGLIDGGDQARRANVLSAIFFGIVWFARQLVPVLVQQVIDLAYMSYVGSLGAALSYEGLSAVRQAVVDRLPTSAPKF
jgi:hypothetical protein